MESDTYHGLALGSSRVCGKSNKLYSKNENARMLTFGIIFINIEIKWSKIAGCCNLGYFFSLKIASNKIPGCRHF